MVPSNGLQELLAILSKARIDKETLQWIGIDCGDFHRKLEKCREQVSEHQKKVVQQLFYLTQEYYHEYYKINKLEHDKFPTLSDSRLNESPSLNDIISDVLENSGLEYIDPQQFFNYTVQKRRLKGSILATEPKKSKWEKAKLILSHSPEFGRLDYHYFLPEMSSEAADREYKRWSIGFANSISNFATGVEVKRFRSINKEEEAPVFVLPGVSAKNLNELFLDPRNDGDIISAITFFTRSDASTEEVELSLFGHRKTTMLDEFNTIKGLFPRIKGHWTSLTYPVRYFVYQCFMNIRTNGFKVLHQQRQRDRSDLPTTYVHGDEWGANFHLSREGVLIPIDFDDMLTNEIDKSRNSHLYRRIWHRTDSQSELSDYVTNVYRRDPTDKQLASYLDVSRSMGRLFCSLIQYWMFRHPKNTLTETVKDRISLLTKQTAAQLDQFGWFWLSFIDWALEWGENSRRKENKFEHYKFVVSEIASQYSRDKTHASRYESNSYLEFFSWLRDRDPDNASERQHIKELFGLKNLTSEQLRWGLDPSLFESLTQTRQNKLLAKIEKNIQNQRFFKDMTYLRQICDIHDLDYEWIDENQVIYDFKFSNNGGTFLDELSNLNLLSFCIDVLKVDDEKIIRNFEQNQLHPTIRELWDGSRV